MPPITNGRYTARMDEPFAVFIIGMWLPLHKDPAVDGRGVIRVNPVRAPDGVPTA